MAKLDPDVAAHLEWIGFVRPTGLVVSAPALVRAGAILDRRDAEGQRLLRSVTAITESDAEDGPVPHVPDFCSFAETVLGWSFSAKGYAGTEASPIPDELEVTLTDYEETLRPDFAVRELDPQEGELPWQLLVRVLEPGTDFDKVRRGAGLLEASVQGRMERLLRQTGVPAGLLFNGRVIRLVSAPRGESSGWFDLRIEDMVQTAGRPICSAMRLLLSQARLLALPREKRLPALLVESRKFQNEVSERLAEQVLHALYELLRGFQAAHDQSKGALLRDVLAREPDTVYRGLLTVLLRLVFLLYAEERDMLPEDETFLQYYSVAGLHERLREDAALYPDTMNQRFGAWAQLLAMFRMIFDGAQWGVQSLPERHGVLFDPDRFPFLEGRPGVGSRQVHEVLAPPLVPDGTVFRALENLMVLDGERISYRALDVEQIGSVYETMMGFRLEIATGRSIAIKATKRHGAPTTVDLDALLTQAPANRSKWLQDRSGRGIPAAVNRELKDADTLEALHAALVKVVDTAASPDLVPMGAMVLQPSEERRRSGSHYTPRELTEPIVRTTLRPVLARLREASGGVPTPEQILDLKICDPAMGSGAFLVETCRQLGDALLESWRAHDRIPETPPDEDEIVFARRLIAQRCLYGVDRNPVAVDLAKVSLWLATLAKDHPFTFLDHAMRHGDSLVGLSRKQIEAFHWDPDASRFQAGFEVMRIQEHLERFTDLRRQIREAGEEVTDRELRYLWDEANAELRRVRFFGDLVVAAFFEGTNATEREEKRRSLAEEIFSGTTNQGTPPALLRDAGPPLVPFHWEVEFPEVFQRKSPGFDAFVGNPPFLGGARVSSVLGMDYFGYLRSAFDPARHQCDLVAHFFRRSFSLLRERGALGLVATSTIAQGDTREGGLLLILREGGEIFSATSRLSWPGAASVVVSVIHITRGESGLRPELDRRPVRRISAFLVEGEVDETPIRLAAGPYFSKGSQIYGQGFVFDDSDSSANSLEVMQDILSDSEIYAKWIFPFIGGKELNRHPVLRPETYVIDVSEISSEDELRRYPRLYELIHERVRPERERLGGNPNNIPLKRRWWAYQAHRPELYERARKAERMLAQAETGPHLVFRFVDSRWRYNKTMIVIDLGGYEGFACLRSRAHQVWVNLLASSLGTSLRYTASDCLATFPFPSNWMGNETLRAAGRSYYRLRDQLLLAEDVGPTELYNRFHDPARTEPQLQELRELSVQLDRAVLDAYGWTRIAADCEFLLSHGEEEPDSRRKEPWSYRWPDEVHDAVLARLLELNAQRAAEERAGGGVSTSVGTVEDGDDRTLDLFDV